MRISGGTDRLGCSGRWRRIPRAPHAHTHAHALQEIMTAGLEVLSGVLAACSSAALPYLEPLDVGVGAPIPNAPLNAAQTRLLDAMFLRLLAATPGAEGQQRCRAGSAVTVCGRTGVRRAGERAALENRVAVTLPPDWGDFAWADGAARARRATPVPYHADVGLGLAYVGGGPLGTPSAVATLFTAEGQRVALDLPPLAPVELRVQLPFPMAGGLAECFYLDTRGGIYSDAGMGVGAVAARANATAVDCRTTHLTEFVVGYRLDTRMPVGERVLMRALMPFWLALLVWAVYLMCAAGLAFRLRYASTRKVRACARARRAVCRWAVPRPRPPPRGLVRSLRIPRTTNGALVECAGVVPSHDCCGASRIHQHPTPSAKTPARAVEHTSSSEKSVKP